MKKDIYKWFVGGIYKIILLYFEKILVRSAVFKIINLFIYEEVVHNNFYSGSAE